MLVEAKKIRRCGFCQSGSTITADTDKQRKYTCDECGAVETITKGKNAGWWYHGWKHEDGRKLRAPTVGEMRQGLYGWQPDERPGSPTV